MPAATPALRLRLSEAAQVEQAGAPQQLLAARDAALLAWLAIEGPTTRLRLGALLWPDSTEFQARITPRQRLFQLKKRLGTDLVSGATVLALADGVEHDLHDAVTLLADRVPADAPELARWLAREREKRQQQGVDALSAQALEMAGAVAAALAVARSPLRLQSLSEAAHRNAIRLLHLTGDSAVAFEGLHDAALAHLDVDTADALGDECCSRLLTLAATVEQTVRAAIVKVRPATRRREHALAEQTALTALAQARRLEDPRWAADGHEVLMETLVLQQRSAEALVHAQACMGWMDTQASVGMRSDFHAALGVLYDNTGLLDRALPHPQRALVAAHECANRFNRASIANNLAGNRLNTGELDAARARAQQRGFGGHVLETHVRAAHLALRVDATRAQRHARLAVGLSDQVDLPFSGRGDLWLHCARDFLAAGDEPATWALLQRGREWVLSTAREQAPPQFRGSILHRNPTQRELLLASRHLPASSTPAPPRANHFQDRS